MAATAALAHGPGKGCRQRLAYLWNGSRAALSACQTSPRQGTACR